MKSNFLYFLLFHSIALMILLRTHQWISNRIITAHILIWQSRSSANPGNLIIIAGRVFWIFLIRCSDLWNRYHSFCHFYWRCQYFFLLIDLYLWSCVLPKRVLAFLFFGILCVSKYLMHLCNISNSWLN